MAQRCTECAKPDATHVTPSGLVLCDDCLRTHVEPVDEPDGQPAGNVEVAVTVGVLSVLVIGFVLYAGVDLLSVEGLAVLIGLGAVVVGNLVRLSRRR